MNEKLKPCPFRGVDVKLQIESGDEGCEYGGSWAYASISAMHKETCPLYMSEECCENSGSIQIVDFSEEQLRDFITAWNTRTVSSTDTSQALKYFNAIWYGIEKHCGVDPECIHYPDVIRAAIVRGLEKK